MEVFLTFDFDAEFVMEQLYPGEKYWIFQGEYGAREGVRRILNFLDDEGIMATFCVVGKAAEKYQETVKNIHSKGHEIANHSYSHKAYWKLSYWEEFEEIKKTQEILENIAETPIGHRTPAWRPSKNTIQILHELGFLWNSDYLGCDTPFYHKNTNILEIPVASTLDDWDLFIDGFKTPNQVFEIWREEFDTLYLEKKIFCLTCHPLVSGRPSRLKALKLLVSHIKEFDTEFLRVKDYVLKKSEKSI